MELKKPNHQTMPGNMELASILIDCLIDEFNSNDINYCHWKSNFHLAGAVSGDGDLDLLVDRKSMPQAIAILSRMGFKAATVRRGPAEPTISHYYGYDFTTGQYVHVHLFSSVLTGESFVKGHLLPFQAMLLENCSQIGKIRTPAKSAELILFVARIFIKYGSPLDLLYLRGKSAEIKEELEWLLHGSENDEIFALLNSYCPVIDKDLFIRCVETLRTSRSLVKKIRLALKVRRRLAVYGKYSRSKRIGAYIHLFAGQVLQRLAGNSKNKMLSTGGAMIAFVGPEATGKSTLVSQTRAWLGEVFAARTIHAGKPPSTFATLPVNVFLPFIRRFMPQMRTSRLEGHVSIAEDKPETPKTKGIAGLIYALRSVALAWDRCRLLQKNRRRAANGEIIICDRYPSEKIGAMDSPRLERRHGSGGLVMRIYNGMARLEAKLYRQIPPPDLVLQLQVSIETAKQRNRDRIKAGKESDDYLESRHRQSTNWQIPGKILIYDIDTEQPLGETILLVKKTVWEAL